MTSTSASPLRFRHLIEDGDMRGAPAYREPLIIRHDTHAGRLRTDNKERLMLNRRRPCKGSSQSPSMTVAKRKSNNFNRKNEKEREREGKNSNEEFCKAADRVFLEIRTQLHHSWVQVVVTEGKPGGGKPSTARVRCAQKGRGNVASLRPH